MIVNADADGLVENPSDPRDRVDGLIEVNTRMKKEIERLREEIERLKEVNAEETENLMKYHALVDALKEVLNT